MKTIFFSFANKLLCALFIFTLVTGAIACGSSKKSKKTPAKPAKKTAPKPSSSAKPTSPAPPAQKPTEKPKSSELEKDKDSKIAFIKSNRLMPVLEEANKLNKPVFVEFFATWCSPCKSLDKEVLSANEVATFVNQNFVSVKINFDTEDGKAVAQLYEVSSLPTMLFLDKKGVELGRMVGLTTPGRFIRAGADAIGKK